MLRVKCANLYLPQNAFDIVLREMAGVVPELLLLADAEVQTRRTIRRRCTHPNTAVMYWNAALVPSAENTACAP